MFSQHETLAIKREVDLEWNIDLCEVAAGSLHEVGAAKQLAVRVETGDSNEGMLMWDLHLGFETAAVDDILGLEGVHCLTRELCAVSHRDPLAAKAGLTIAQ